MGILEFLMVCGACAALLWFIQWAFNPPAVVQKIMIVAIVVVLVATFLFALGLLPLRDTQIPRVR